MADPGGTAWTRIIGALAPSLPGDWTVRGGRGAKAVLVRQPVEWTFAWIGLDRVRVTDHPYLMSGLVPLVIPVDGFSAFYGLRSDEAWLPGTVDLLSATAPETVRRFILSHAVPMMEPWTPQALANAAEDSYRRAEPGFDVNLVQAAGWRVVNESGSPVEPAERAIELFRPRHAPEVVTWYEKLTAAWNQGGRPAALTYLEQHRQDVLTRLKLA